MFRPHRSSAERVGPEDVLVPEQRQYPVKARNACRLRHSKEVNQAVEVVRESHRLQPDRVKVFRLHRSSVAKAAANPASDLRVLVGQVVREEQRILRRRQLSSVHHSPNQNVVDRRRDARAKSQMPSKVRQDRSRRRIASEDLSVSGSARRLLLAQANTGNVAEARHQDFVNR